MYKFIDDNNTESTKRKIIRKKVIYFIVACSLLICFIGGIIFGYKNYYNKNSKKNIVETQWGNIELDVPQSKETVNVMLIGFDKGGYRTDTMMIVNFNPKTSKVNLISIPRDTLIGIDNKKMKLNAVFGIGKFDLTLKSIKQLTGLPIHYYIAVDTEGFKNIIDTLDGVEFDVKKDMKYYDPSQNLNINLKKGLQVLDGAKAEQLVRYRKYVMGDLEREEIQKQFIKALIEQKLTLENVSDVSKMKKLYSELKKDVKTNVTFDDGTKYFVSAMKIKPENINTYVLPGNPQNIRGVSYYIYDKKKMVNLLALITGKEIQKVENSFGNLPRIEIYDTEKVAQLYAYKKPIVTQPIKENSVNTKEIQDEASVKGPTIQVTPQEINEETKVDNEIIEENNVDNLLNEDESNDLQEFESQEENVDTINQNY